MERLADPVTSSLLALLFVGVASTSPLRALPLTFTENEGKSAYRWSSNQTAIIAPQAFDSEVGNVEVHLFTTDGKNIKVVQKTRRGAVEPDAISITVPYSFDDDDNTGLYCYLSEEGYGFVQLYFADDASGKKAPLSSKVDIMFRVFFDEVRKYTGQNEITAANIGFGIIREVPMSLLKALDAVLDAAGGCNYETILPRQMPPAGAVTGLNRAE
jgi:hypothetical protein